MSVLTLLARVLLAAAFALAGVTKLADRAGSRTALEEFGMPRRLAAPGGVALPVCELAVALGLLIPTTAWWSAIAALVLLSIFSTAIGANLARGREPDCHCFGQVHSAPAGWPTLLRNLALAAVAIVVLAAGPDEMLGPLVWVGDLSATELVFGGVALLLAVMAVAQSFFLLQLLRQNGRIISRLTSLESQALGSPPAGLGEAGNADREAGLAMGSFAPEFELPSLDGSGSLSDLRRRGNPVLLIFSDPDCVPCGRMLPEVGAWQRELSNRLTIALLSRGTVEQNAAKAEEHGLAHVLLQEDGETSSSFQADGTPSAVLVSADGRIATPLARGPRAIGALVETVTAVGADSLATTSPGSSAPLAVGEEVPDLSWEDAERRGVALRELRGSRVTLLFWNPDCGFCKPLAPSLKAWQEAHRDEEHRLVVISPRMLEDDELAESDLTLVLEQDFTTGPLFGVRGTPSGVAIDAGGRVAALPGVGGPALLELLETQSTSGATA